MKLVVGPVTIHLSCVYWQKCPAVSRAFGKIFQKKCTSKTQKCILATSGRKNLCFLAKSGETPCAILGPIHYLVHHTGKEDQLTNDTGGDRSRDTVPLSISSIRMAPCSVSSVPGSHGQPSTDAQYDALNSIHLCCRYGDGFSHIALLGICVACPAKRHLARDDTHTGDSP